MERVLGVRLALLVALLFMGFVLFFRSPHRPRSYPPCPSYTLTRTYCPGCGTLRSLHALVHGDLRQALAYNVLTVIFYPVLILGLIYLSLRQALRPRTPARPWPTWIPWALVVLFVLFWVLRNIPLEPFSLLAPHALPAGNATL